MRASVTVSAAGLAAGLLAVLSAGAADDPAALLKAVAPAGTGTRVRIPFEGGFPGTAKLKAQVPSNKKKGELIDITAAIDTQPGRSYVSVKTAEAWGYAPQPGPQGKEIVVPELLIAGVQVAPAPKKSGRDVTVKVSNVRLSVVETPPGVPDTIYGCTISLSAAELYKGAERALEPRVAFADKFIELTAPPAALKRLTTEDQPVPEVTADKTEGLVAAAAPTAPRGGIQSFTFVSVNGQDTYKLGNGTVVPVVGGVSSITNWDTGVVVTIGLARGCKVEMDQAAAAQTGTGVQNKTEMIPGKLGELRIGLGTGPGLKVQKDLVLKDVPVYVDKNISEGYLWVGPKFIDTYFKDGVYAAGPDGAWKLHGRCPPDLLQDIKTRKKP